jgi:hypothetical protein
MEDQHGDQEKKLEQSFLKQNFGEHPGLDMEGKPVPGEEQQLIDNDLRHLIGNHDDTGEGKTEDNA